MNEIKIYTANIKLGDFLKFSGEAITGGTAKELIADGLVFVNGEICTMRGKKLVNGDIIKVYNNSYKVINTP